MEENTVNQFNEEPVYYCGNCLSLRIKSAAVGLDFCDRCGGTLIEKTKIEDWEKMHTERYGFRYLNK